MSTMTKAQQLLELAAERSSDKRRSLLREITSVFLVDPENHSDAEHAHFEEIISNVAKDSDRQARMELAERLADVNSAPKKVVRSLIGDEISVARPILERGRSLTDAELIDIVQSTGSAHQKTIARRQDLSDAVSNAIVESGQTEAVQALLENESAKITEATFEKAVSRSEKEVALQEPLVARRDMPVELAQDLFWIATPGLRRKIAIKSSTAEPSGLPKYRNIPASAYIDKPNDNDPSMQKARTYIDKMHRSGWLNRSLVIDRLRQKNIPELVVGLSRLAELSETTARRVVYDRSGEGMAIVCKAIGFDRTAFETLVCVGTPDHDRTDEEIDGSLAMFDSLTAESAQRIMRFWRVRQAVLAKVPG